MKRAVFVDLDGTLVRAFAEGNTTRGPRILDEVEFLPGTRVAIARLHWAGFLCIVVTNKPDVARGLMGLKAVYAIHRVVRKVLDLGTDRIYFCPHDDDAKCNCRKPRPQLILNAAAEHDIDLANSWLIGDRQTDIEAAHAAGIHSTVKVQTNEGILEATKWILRNAEPRSSSTPPT